MGIGHPAAVGRGIGPGREVPAEQPVSAVGRLEVAADVGEGLDGCEGRCPGVERLVQRAAQAPDGHRPPTEGPDQQVLSQGATGARGDGSGLLEHGVGFGLGSGQLALEEPALEADRLLPQVGDVTAGGRGPLDDGPHLVQVGQRLVASLTR